MTLQQTSNFYNKNNNISQIYKIIEEKQIKQLDFKIVNTWGSLYHMSVPIQSISNNLLEHGLPFDGSSVSGFSDDLNLSDCRMKPDINTMFIDLFHETKTLAFLCNIVDIENPLKYHPFCSRNIIKKTEDYLNSMFECSSLWGPELEFYLFSNVRFDLKDNGCFYIVDAKESSWNRGIDMSPNLGITLNHQKGYCLDKPFDQMDDIRSKIVSTAIDIGINPNLHHHEVGSAGQCEISLKHNSLPNVTDEIVLLKYIIRNVAHQSGFAATFMPKPLSKENGSGLHFHQSFIKDNKPLFYDEYSKFFKLSKWALSYIAGILYHMPALMAFTNATTNSYKRLHPGFEAPTNRSFSLGNRTSAIRIPKYAITPESKRIECRISDASGNIYYSMSAMQLAGIDGVKKGLDPFKLGFDAINKKPKKMLPISLMDAMDALKKDHRFLTETGVFSEELIEIWIEKKRREYLELERFPHPYEFREYFGC